MSETGRGAAMTARPKLYLVNMRYCPTEIDGRPAIYVFTGTRASLPSPAIVAHPKNESIIRNTLSDYFDIVEPTQEEWTEATRRRGYGLNMPIDHTMDKAKKRLELDVLAAWNEGKGIQVKDAPKPENALL